MTPSSLCAVLIALALLLPAITPASAVPRSGDERDYVFVLIRTGPAEDLSVEEQQEAFRGHFSNMSRMADAGDLLIAGPFGPPLAEPDHRGLWVFNTESLDEGLAFGATDPTTIAGVFVLEGFVFTTDAPLTELTQLEKDAEAERLADPDIPDEWVGRGYVLVTAPHEEAALESLRKTDGVLIVGTLHGSGPDESDQILAWLDAQSEDDARDILPEGDWTLHGWYGSATVEAMDD